MARSVLLSALVSFVFLESLPFSVQPALAQNTRDSGAERGQADRVLSRDQQAALTPDAVLAELLEGNQRFAQDDLTTRNHSARVREAYAGQFPKANPIPQLLLQLSL